ncbi:unnamed protein product, partial [Dicrocoelium dendriticum]
LLFQLLESLDVKTKALAYCFAGGLLLGSFYWSAVTYGAVTVMQVLGHQQGLQMMRRTDPLLLLLGLPTIPACLLLLRTVPWENFLVVLWRHYLSRLIPFRWLTDTSNWPAREAIVDSSSEGHEFPRFLCASLTLPTVAAMTGQLLFPKVRTNTRRILLGALAYLGLKGLLSVSYTEMKYMRACHRMVKNYEGD